MNRKADMNQHRIEFLIKTPDQLETLTITISANSRQDHLATLTKKIRALLEFTLFTEPPLTIETCRDYPVVSDEKRKKQND